MLKYGMLLKILVEEIGDGSRQKILPSRDLRPATHVVVGLSRGQAMLLSP